MYLSSERVASYPVPVRPDFTSTQAKAANVVRQILTALLGREFMGLRARHKVAGCYCILSIAAPVALCSDGPMWMAVLLIANLANAVRMVNRIVREASEV